MKALRSRFLRLPVSSKITENEALRARNGKKDNNFRKPGMSKPRACYSCGKRLIALKARNGKNDNNFMKPGMSKPSACYSCGKLLINII